MNSSTEAEHLLIEHVRKCDYANVELCTKTAAQLDEWRRTPLVQQSFTARKNFENHVVYMLADRVFAGIFGDRVVDSAVCCMSHRKTSASEGCAQASRGSSRGRSHDRV
eukprot:SAG31_NODE_8156_length_1507_cov_1.671165_1_plen_109_part_00